MPGFNKVILAGHLTRDPQPKTVGGTTLCTFGLAMNRKYKKADGEPGEEVCFVDCTAWGRQAETLARYTRKGQALLVEGRLKLDEWTATDGTKRSRLTVVVEAFQFLGGKSGGPGGSAPEPDPPPQAQNGPDELPF